MTTINSFIRMLHFRGLNVRYRTIYDYRADRWSKKIETNDKSFVDESYTWAYT